eukprot:469731-Ditylum_brightwellii.AAC.1
MSNAYAGISSTPVAVIMTALVVSLIDVVIVDDHWNGFNGCAVLILWSTSAAAWKGERWRTQDVYNCVAICVSSKAVKIVLVSSLILFVILVKMDALCAVGFLRNA